jgi:hypothetical protein
VERSRHIRITSRRREPGPGIPRNFWRVIPLPCVPRARFLHLPKQLSSAPFRPNPNLAGPCAPRDRWSAIRLQAEQRGQARQLCPGAPGSFPSEFAGLSDAVAACTPITSTGQALWHSLHQPQSKEYYAGKRKLRDRIYWPNGQSSMHWLKRFSKGGRRIMTQPSGFGTRDLRYRRPGTP